MSTITKGILFFSLATAAGILLAALVIFLGPE
jgi:hypothetical protein